MDDIDAFEEWHSIALLYSNKGGFALYYWFSEEGGKQFVVPIKYFTCKRYETLIITYFSFVSMVSLSTTRSSFIWVSFVLKVKTKHHNRHFLSKTRLFKIKFLNPVNKGNFLLLFKSAYLPYYWILVTLKIGKLFVQKDI